MGVLHIIALHNRSSALALCITSLTLACCVGAAVAACQSCLPRLWCPALLVVDLRLDIRAGIERHICHQVLSVDLDQHFTQPFSYALCTYVLLGGSLVTGCHKTDAGGSLVGW